MIRTKIPNVQAQISILDKKIDKRKTRDGYLITKIVGGSYTKSPKTNVKKLGSYRKLIRNASENGILAFSLVA